MSNLPTLGGEFTLRQELCFSAFFWRNTMQNQSFELKEISSSSTIVENQCEMLNHDIWCVIENAGYVGEVNVASVSSHSEAVQYINDNYTLCEIERFHVEITCNGSYEY